MAPEIRINRTPGESDDVRQKRQMGLAKKVLESHPHETSATKTESRVRYNATASVKMFSAFAFGTILGIGIMVTLGSRFTIVNARIPLRFDRWTGKSWVYSTQGNGEWRELSIRKQSSAGTRAKPPFDPDAFLEDRPQPGKTESR
jgi:hypothetical protein